VNRPALDLLLYGGALVLIAIYLFASLDRIAAQYQLLTMGVGVYIGVTGALALFRFRAAAPLYLAAMVFLLSWALLRVGWLGYSQGRMAMILGSLVAIPGYWVLKSALGEVAAQDG
jgi:hypothetical protein